MKESVELVRLERAAVVEVRRQECPLEVGYCVLIELRGTARVSESDSDAAAQRRTRSPASAAGSGSGSGCGTATASLSKLALSGFSAVSIPPRGAHRVRPRMPTSELWVGVASDAFRRWRREYSRARPVGALHATASLETSKEAPNAARVVRHAPRPSMLLSACVCPSVTVS